MKPVLLVSLLVCAGCADTLLGVSPLSEDPARLKFPLGIAAVGGARDVLYVASTNFDQRFNAGLLHAFDLSAVGAQVAAEVPWDQVCRDEAILLAPDIDGFIGALRIPSATGPLQQVDLPLVGQSLITGSRFDQTLVVFDLQTDASDATLPEPGTPPEPDDLISCRTPGSETGPFFDCAPSHLFPMAADDPYLVTWVDGREGFLAVTHLAELVPAPGAPLRGFISVLTEERITARLQGRALAGRATAASLVGFRGSIGLTTRGDGVLASSDRASGGEMLVAQINADDLLDARQGRVIDIGDNLAGPSTDPSRVFPADTVDLRPRASAVALRGLELFTRPDGAERAITTLLVPDAADTSNAGIALVSLQEDDFQVEGLLEVGEEVGRPSLSPWEPGRLLYVPDVRGDALYVIDISTDIPVVAQRIGGRTVRVEPIEGSAPEGLEPVRQRAIQLLSGPVELAFDPRPRMDRQGNARRFLYVTNFRNSTLAVVDVTDPSPSRHCIVARLGRLRLGDGSGREELL